MLTINLGTIFSKSFLYIDDILIIKKMRIYVHSGSKHLCMGGMFVSYHVLIAKGLWADFLTVTS